MSCRGPRTGANPTPRATGQPVHGHGPLQRRAVDRGRSALMARTLSPPLTTVSEALELASAQLLRPMLALLPNAAPPPRRKAEMIAEIEGLLRGDPLRSLWDALDETQQTRRARGPGHAGRVLRSTAIPDEVRAGCPPASAPEPRRRPRPFCTSSSTRPGATAPSRRSCPWSWRNACGASCHRRPSPRSRQRTSCPKVCR